MTLPYYVSLLKVVFIWVLLKITMASPGYIEAYPKDPLILTYNNIRTSNVEYIFKFRLSNAVFPHQYLRVQFPSISMPDLVGLTKCHIKEVPGNNTGDLLNSI